MNKTDLTRLLIRDLIGGRERIERNEPVAQSRKSASHLSTCAHKQNIPMQDLAPSLPFGRRLEPRVPAH